MSTKLVSFEVRFWQSCLTAGQARLILLSSFPESEVNQPAIDFRRASDQVIAEATKGGTARIVFFLTLNGRALRQVTRLIKSLFHERHYFYIHIDAVSSQFLLLDVH